MLIYAEEFIVIEITPKDGLNIFNRMKEGDLVMYKGDTYKIIDSKEEPVRMTATYKMQLMARAANMYVISPDKNITEVGYYLDSCKVK